MIVHWLKRWCRRMKWDRREFVWIYNAEFDISLPVRRYKARFQRDIRRGIIDERGNLIKRRSPPCTGGAK